MTAFESDVHDEIALPSDWRYPEETGDVEFVEVPGGRLWTAATGDGPALLLCHGGPGLADNLGGLASLVDDRARVVRFDQRGAGRSTPGGPLTIDRFVEDLECLRIHKGLESWAVGGHSWGATLAIAYACRHPGRVDGLFLVSCPGLDWGWQSATAAARMARLSDRDRATVAVALDRMGDRSLPPNARAEARRSFLTRMWATDFADPANAAFLADRPLYPFGRREEVFAALSSELKSRIDALREDAASLNVPTTIVHGLGDPNPTGGRDVAAAMPEARLVELPGVGHTTWMERPESTAQALHAFVASLGG